MENYPKTIDTIALIAKHNSSYKYLMEQLGEKTMAKL